METKKTLEQVLVDHFDFEGLSPEEEKALKNDLAELLLENTFIRIMEDVTEEQAAEFEAFLDTEPTRSEFIHFLDEKVPQFYPILFEEVELLKKEA